MTFADLPPDWPTRPVTDPDITPDLLDLVVRDVDRVDGALCILLCGEQGQLVHPMVFPRPPTRMSREQRGTVFAALEALAAEEGLRGGILVAVAREKGAFVTDTDRAWHDAAIASCRASGLRLLGVWVVTRRVIRQVPGLDDVGVASA